MSIWGIDNIPLHNYNITIMKVYYSPEFKVFNNKVVKCSIRCLIKEYNNFITPVSKLRGIELTKRQVVNNTFCIFTVSGIAKCDKHDTFDLEKGKRIAESRAMIKSFQIISDLAILSKKELAKKDNALTDYFNRAEYLLAREKDHLNTLIDD